jgi:hypothetical protein
MFGLESREDLSGIRTAKACANTLKTQTFAVALSCVSINAKHVWVESNAATVAMQRLGMARSDWLGVRDDVRNWLQLGLKARERT